jgi:putative FmdB family regulatory protein
MPLFEYRCQDCRRRFSLLVGMTAEKPRLQCPKCGSRKATKLISQIARVPRGDDSDDDFDDLGPDDDFDEGTDDDSDDDLYDE